MQSPHPSSWNQRPSRACSQRLRAYCVLGVTGVALTAFAAVAVLSRPPSTDAAHCTVDSSPSRSAHVLVDLTDRHPPNAVQRARIRADIQALANALEDRDLLEIVLLAAPAANQPAQVETVFAGCRPQSPGTAGLTKGKRVLEKQLHASWRQPLEQALKLIDVRAGSAATSTPLIAAMQQLRPRMRGQQRQIVVYSDLLEHTAALDMYATAPHFKTLRAAGLDIAQVDGLFQGVAVDVVQLDLPQAAPLQTRARALWQDWFSAAGGVVRFRRI